MGKNGRKRSIVDEGRRDTRIMWKKGGEAL